MSNFITASVEFFFKGEKISASIELDLNTNIQKKISPPHIYLMLARSINIDLYSYEYEMMQAETILFSNAKGMVADHVNDGILDIDAFTHAHRHHSAIEKLALIAKKHMSIDDLSVQTELQQALLEAYQLGLDEVLHKD